MLLSLSLIGISFLAAADPTLIVANSFEVEGRVVKTGMPQTAAVAALGGGAKLEKAAIYTAKRLAEQQQLIVSLAPWDSGFAEWFTSATADCDGCWLALLTKRLSKTDEIRVVLKGHARDALAVAGIVLDRAATSDRLVGQAITDSRENASYFVTPGGTYRVSLSANIVKIDRLK